MNIFVNTEINQRYAARRIAGPLGVIPLSPFDENIDEYFR